jgi:hypothetical protein
MAEQCNVEADLLYNYLINHSRLKGKLIFKLKRQNHWSFSMIFLIDGYYTNNDYHAVTISFSPSERGNRGSIYGEGVPSTIEMLLFGKFKDECGFNNSRYYDSRDNLVDDILNISTTISYLYKNSYHPFDKISDRMLVDDI